ncbi:adenine-specific DNA-methyltransferase [Curtobacterium sp. PhB171]|nr:adenine-specific DNA-methyltransferase [Curtobacterium sp. PhB171]ROQ23099.1 adenine-specific DNA-methyltransferase [Curtobacterium sp. PhB170]ROS33948.1 adenine-specific DNA-methyltransferase [Curtobacterium sp. PhB131]ROS66547.1 adenine-specific DNA-methyltransferase [Curtobacterium sp. PhB141]
MTSPDLTQTNIDRLAELFPTVVTETVDEVGGPRRSIDFDLLRQELTDHIVEGPQERYQLDWPGKRAAAFAANAPIAKTLRPVREESVDFDATKNLFIEGDNLDALKLLQESYLGKVKLIYIDPPYNTGNDFVYEDDFGQTAHEYLAGSGQFGTDGTRFVANTEANGRFHSDWLSMILPRLKLARTLLAQDGVIFISIDDHEVASLRKVADEVFGESNFVASAVWQKRTSPEARKRLAAGHEYILVYARNATVIEEALSPLPLDERDRSAFSNPDNDPRGPWVSSDFTAPGFRPNQMYAITTPSGAVVSPPPGRCWMNLEDEYKKQVAERRFWYGPDGTGIPRRKTYLAERNGKSAWTWWPNSEVGHTQEGTREVRALFDKDGETFFDFPKPVRLIERVVQLATKTDRANVVVDFFAGSGTTAHAVMNANLADGGNRRFVLVQMPELLDAKSAAAIAGYHSIADISRDRVRRAGAAAAKQALGRDSALDVGFRSLRIDTTNMTDLDATADDLVQASLMSAVDSVKPDRSNEDLLFQVLLDWGLELAAPITVEEVASRCVLSVDDDALIACFANQVTEDLVKTIAARHPLRAVFLDAGFETDAARINAEQIFREVSPETDVRTI